MPEFVEIDKEQTQRHEANLHDVAVTSRVAIRLLGKTKSELVAVARALDAVGAGGKTVYDETIDNLKSGIEISKAFTEAMEAAEWRLLCAATVIALETAVAA